MLALSPALAALLQASLLAAAAWCAPPGAEMGAQALIEPSRARAAAAAAAVALRCCSPHAFRGALQDARGFALAPVLLVALVDGARLILLLVSALLAGEAVRMNAERLYACSVALSALGQCAAARQSRAAGGRLARILRTAAALGALLAALQGGERVAMRAGLCDAAFGAASALLLLGWRRGQDGAVTPPPAPLVSPARERNGAASPSAGRVPVRAGRASFSAAASAMASVAEAAVAFAAVMVAWRSAGAGDGAVTDDGDGRVVGLIVLACLVGALLQLPPPALSLAAFAARAGGDDPFVSAAVVPLLVAATLAALRQRPLERVRSVHGIAAGSVLGACALAACDGGRSAVDCAAAGERVVQVGVAAAVLRLWLGNEGSAQGSSKGKYQKPSRSDSAAQLVSPLVSPMTSPLASPRASPPGSPRSRTSGSSQSAAAAGVSPRLPSQPIIAPPQNRANPLLAGVALGALALLVVWLAGEVAAMAAGADEGAAGVWILAAALAAGALAPKRWTEAAGAAPHVTAIAVAAALVASPAAALAARLALAAHAAAGLRSAARLLGSLAPGVAAMAVACVATAGSWRALAMAASAASALAGNGAVALVAVVAFAGAVLASRLASDSGSGSEAKRQLRRAAAISRAVLLSAAVTGLALAADARPELLPRLPTRELALLHDDWLGIYHAPARNEAPIVETPTTEDTNTVSATVAEATAADANVLSEAEAPAADKFDREQETTGSAEEGTDDETVDEARQQLRRRQQARSTRHRMQGKPG